MKNTIIVAALIISTLFGIININVEPAEAGYWRCEGCVPWTQGGDDDRGSYCFRLGDRGPLIYDLIEELRKAGYYHLINGSYFGPVTERAVIKFQRDNQLRPDGVAGPQTQNLLLLRNQQILKLPNSW